MIGRCVGTVGRGRAAAAVRPHLQSHKRPPEPPPKSQPCPILPISDPRTPLRLNPPISDPLFGLNVVLIEGLHCSNRATPLSALACWTDGQGSMVTDLRPG